MKRSYSKPEIVFEDFSLSVNIAAGCEHLANFSRELICGYDVTDDFGFATGTVVFTLMNACNAPASDGDIHNGICYHNPNENNNLFSS